MNNRQALIRRGYVRIPTGQVHYRTAGAGPPVILLHYSFLSSAMYLALIDRLADQFTIIALDTPGYGASDPLNLGRQAEIDDFGDALADTIEALGLEAPVVYSSHTSAKFALSCACRHPDTIAFLICDGLAAPETPLPADYIARYMKPFVITGDGGYIGENWTMMRDFRRFYPWFEPIAAHRMSIDQASLEDDHVFALSLFSAGPNYVSAYGAALRYAPLPAVRASRTPTLYLAREDDVLAHFLDALEPHLPPQATLERLPADENAWTRRLRAIFTAHAKGRRVAPARTAPQGDFDRTVVAMPHGDIEVRSYGPMGVIPTVLALHDCPGAAATLHSLCAALAIQRKVLAPDLPGCALSDPLPKPDAENYVEALVGVLDHFDVQAIDVIAEGLSAPLALALAARAPGRVSRLVLDAALLADAAERETLARRYCPPIALNRQGGHMLEVWQRVRDMELQWPWYDESRQAIRQVDPMLDPETLHRRMLGILFQVDRYGDACQAALSIDGLDILDAIGAPTTILTRVGDPRYPTAARISPRARLVETPPTAGGAIASVLKALD